MHPNKFRCAWLGQGGALKVVSKGFEGAMMLGAEKIDRSKISVLPKTGEKLGRFGEFWGSIWKLFSPTATARRERTRRVEHFWPVVWRPRTSHACDRSPYTPVDALKHAKVSIVPRGADPGRAGSCSGKSARHTTQYIPTPGALRPPSSQS